MHEFKHEGPSTHPTLGERVAAAETLWTAAGLQTSEVERRLGLSRGYVSQCRPTAANPREPKRTTVLLLECVARHPEEFHLFEE